VPSLFTFTIPDQGLTALQGLVVPNALVGIPATSFRSQGALLITHWGLSGPAILKLSSYAARHLAEQKYQSPLRINWTGETDAEAVRLHITYILEQNAQRLIDHAKPYGLQTRLWTYLLSKVELQGKRCNELGKKGLNRLVELLTNDTYTIAGRSPYKDEFVTCGGISLSSINSNTLESKHYPRLYFAGEVLDIDGVTGGFNFQAAWTTAYTVASAISTKASS
jgi:predicted Rossmann fold flavoprotein